MQAVKKNVFLLVLLVVLLPLNAEESIVELTSHPFNLEAAKREINEVCARGFVPVGLEVIDGVAIQILYARDDSLSFKEWFLYQLTEPEKLESAVSYIIQNGWVPTGISKTDTALYMIFIKADLEVEGWRVSKSGSDTGSIEAKWRYFAQESFFPWGISQWDGETWHLLLQTKNFAKSAAQLRSYLNQESELADGMNKDISIGLHPWGLTVERSRISILYAE